MFIFNVQLFLKYHTNHFNHFAQIVQKEAVGNAQNNKQISDYSTLRQEERLLIWRSTKSNLVKAHAMIKETHAFVDSGSKLSLAELDSLRSGQASGSNDYKKRKVFFTNFQWNWLSH